MNRHHHIIISSIIIIIHHHHVSNDSGVLDTKMAPKAVTLREESELQAMMERLALEQEEVDGDTPEDS
jgi:hypothetical protein